MEVSQVSRGAKRVKRACTSCAARKVKCDGRSPCFRCCKRGESGQCKLKRPSENEDRYSTYVNEKQPMSLVDRMIAIHEETERKRKQHSRHQQVTSPNKNWQEADPLSLSDCPFTNKCEDRQIQSFGSLQMKPQRSDDPPTFTTFTCNYSSDTSLQALWHQSSIPTDQNKDRDNLGNPIKVPEEDLTFRLESKRKFEASPSMVLQSMYSENQKGGPGGSHQPRKRQRVIKQTAAEENKQSIINSEFALDNKLAFKLT